MKIPEGWPTGNMCLAFEDASGVKLSMEEFDEGLRAALEVVPTPPVPTCKDYLQVAASNLVKEMRLHTMSFPEKELGRLEEALNSASPAARAEPVGVVKHWNVGGSGEFYEVQWTLPVPQDGSKLYTHAPPDKLRQAAKELLRVLNEGGNRAKAMQDLNKALEGRS